MNLDADVVSLDDHEIGAVSRRGGGCETTRILLVLRVDHAQDLVDVGRQR